MVVTRRTPVVPSQQPTRNHNPQETQQLPPPRTLLSRETSNAQKNGGSSVATASIAGSSDNNRDHKNGLDNGSGKKPKRSGKHSKKKYQKSNFQAFLDFLTKLILLAFTIYTFSVCPQDTHLQSPICRGLTEYKRIVLDPYIIPPIQAALAHPSIAPHIERARPYVHHATDISAPILARVHQEWNLRVVPQWERRVVPEWNKRIVPQWNKYVVPQWNEHVAPRIQLVQSTVEPYQLCVMQIYGQRVAPRIHMALYNLRRWQHQSEPYVLLAMSKIKDGYYAAKPYVIPFAKRCGHLLHQFALFLREQRQAFVDPHVAKIWEKVQELSRGRQIIHETAPERGSLSSDMDTHGYGRYEITASSTDASTYVIPIPEATDDASISSTLGTGKITEVAPTFTSVPDLTASAQFVVVDVGSFSSAEAVLTAPLHETEHRASGATAVTKEFETAAPSVTIEATASSNASPFTDEPATAPVSAPSKITVAAVSATAPSPNARSSNEIDYDAFYAELGLDEPLGNPGDSEAVPPDPPEETEEEKAERLRLQAEETARKRADIEARQAKWEAELEAQMERSTSQLQTRLVHLRTAAAAELSTSAEVRNSIEELVGEAEKYLKGAEIYLKNLKGENRRADEKLVLWDRVAERVSEKFGERLVVTKSALDAWYKIALDKELQEVATASAEVRDVAEKGHLDLGLDYAWLEDVTSNDWQRYHALVGTSEQYADAAVSIQSGTHPNVVVMNPMSFILQDLESEIQDVVIGFETRLRRIRRDGERAFSNHGNGVTPKEEEKGSSEPDLGAGPEVSILPVPSEDAREKEQGFIPPVIIGRSREEVLEALGKVESINNAEREVSRSHVDPEEAISRLVREMETGGGIAHTEL